MPRKKRDVSKRHQQKGFTLDETRTRDHKCFYLYNSDGTRTIVWTKISHGSNKDIHDGLLGEMMKQIHLNKKQFNEYMDCTLRKEKYLEILKQLGLYH